MGQDGGSGGSSSASLEVHQQKFELKDDFYQLISTTKIGHTKEQIQLLYLIIFPGEGDSTLGLYSVAITYSGGMGTENWTWHSAVAEDTNRIQIIYKTDLKNMYLVKNECLWISASWNEVNYP